MAKELRFEPRGSGKSVAWAMELLKRLNEMPEDQEFVFRKGEHGIYGNTRPKNFKEK